MKNNAVLDSHFQSYISIINDVFKELHQLTLDIRNKELAQTVDDIRTRLNEPFLFVIVGEVKVGKSSFVNALLETQSEVCKVAPDPCTDTIQQIVYGVQEKTITINEYLKKIMLPVDILKKVAIVDTPGTNAVLAHHQEITERFIPVSDLIIFVFEAKNPYRQSAWKFFEYIKKWQKKIIFVLQQSDLMEEDDLEVNVKGVIDYAKQRGIDEPRIFCVSAKNELKGLTEESGFAPVREFIKNTVTGGNNIRLKIQSLLDTSKKIRHSISEGIEERHEQLEHDAVFRRKVDTLLDNAEAKSGDQVDELVEEMLREYDKHTTDIRDEFEEGLGVFTLLKKSIFSLFNEKQSLKEWMNGITDKVDNKLKPALEQRLKDGIVNLADGIRQMSEIIDVEIRKNKSGIRSNNQVFSDIANKRQEKLEKLQQHIHEFSDETEEFLNTDMLKKSSSIVPDIATGSGIAAIALILGSVVHGVAFDITGGVVSAVALSVTGIWTAFKRKRIIREFRDEIAKGRQKLEEEVREKLKAYIKEIRIKIDNNFLEFDTFINEEKRNLDELAEKNQAIEGKFSSLIKDLELEG